MCAELELLQTQVNTYCGWALKGSAAWAVSLDEAIAGLGVPSTAELAHAHTCCVYTQAYVHGWHDLFPLRHVLRAETRVNSYCRWL